MESPALICSQDITKSKVLRELPSSHPLHITLPSISCLSRSSFNPRNWTFCAYPKVDHFFLHSICSCILDPPTSGITSPTPPVSFLTSPPITLPTHTLHPLASPLASYVLLQHVYHFLMLRNLHVLFFIARLPLFEHKPQGNGGVCLFFLCYTTWV